MSVETETNVYSNAEFMRILVSSRLRGAAQMWSEYREQATNGSVITVVQGEASSESKLDDKIERSLQYLDYIQAFSGTPHMLASDDDIQFPSIYRNVELTNSERYAIRAFFDRWDLDEQLVTLDGEGRATVEHLFVADALCSHAKAVLDVALQNSNRDLAQVACESAERASIIARYEPIYFYRLATLLSAAGFTANAHHYFRVFINRSSVDIGFIGRSPCETDDFQIALDRAKEIARVQT